MELNARGMYEPSPAKAVNDLPRGSRTVYDTPQHTVCEPKIDGVRVLLHFLPNGRIEATSRRRDQSGFYSRLTENLPHLTHLGTGAHPFGDGYTILDGEIIMPTKVGRSAGSLGSIMSIVGSLPERALRLQAEYGLVQYCVFDCLMYRGQDLRTFPLAHRRQIAQIIVAGMGNANVSLVPQFPVSAADDKRQYMGQMLAAGFEGLVLKDPNAGYYDKHAWLKVKPEETLDVVVHGFKPGHGKYRGTLGALKGSVIDAETGQLVSVCAAMPGDDRERAELFARIKDLTTEETLALAIIVEVEFQGWTVDGKLRHPRTRRYRPDRSEPNTVDFRKVKRL